MSAQTLVAVYLTAVMVILAAIAMIGGYYTDKKKKDPSDKQ